MVSAFQRIEHIGIAVNDIDSAEILYSKILNSKPYKREEVESQVVLTSFFQVGDNKIELLQAMSLESPISSFISQKGEGIHHIAYLVSDISREMNRLSKSGFSLIDEKPLKGADNMWVAFLHPKTTGGTLIELCQPIPLK